MDKYNTAELKKYFHQVLFYLYLSESQMQQFVTFLAFFSDLFTFLPQFLTSCLLKSSLNIFSNNLKTHAYIFSIQCR